MTAAGDPAVPMTAPGGPAAPTLRDRFRGSLLGLATGDALGTTVEFQRPGSFTPVTTITGGGCFKLPRGAWTDDTSLALCLAESLIESTAPEGWDPHDQMERYVRWWRHGHLSSVGRCFDIGGTTRSALARFEETGDPLAGPTSARSAGNGSIMRLAPVPLRFHRDPVEAVERSAESSRTTHGAAVAVDACRLLGALVAAAANGVSKDELLAPGYFTATHTPEIGAIGAGSFRERQPPAIRGSGYAAESLEAALWALHHSTSFAEGALLAVNLGDDADTTGAVYGQLAGALYGTAGIPDEWLANLHAGDLITGFADRLLDRATA